MWIWGRSRSSKRLSGQKNIKQSSKLKKTRSENKRSKRNTMKTSIL